MASPILSIVNWVFLLPVTLIGILALTCGVISLVRRVREGTPEPGHMRSVGKRTWMLLTTALSHREFKGRPWVGLAYWFVMISFLLLFLMLVAGYGQLRNQHSTLPLIGHLIPWEWLTEFFTWGGLFRIIALTIIHARSGRGSAAEAALSNNEPDQTAASLGARKGELPLGLLRSHPRDDSPKDTASRFLSSIRWQALFIEWVVLIVCACIITLRGLEFALGSVVPGTTLGVGLVQHFPLTSWVGTLLIGASVSATGITNGVVLVATLRIIISILQMIVVGIQTSMGITWHCFLAVIDVYARRKAGGSKSLGAVDHMLISDKPVTSPDILDDLDEDIVFGASGLTELSWEAHLNLYACIECGRCQELCPTWNTAKPLSPRLFIISIRDRMEPASKKRVVSQQASDAQVPREWSATQPAASGEIMLDKGIDSSPHSLGLLEVLAASGVTGPIGVADVDAPLVPEVVFEETLQDCTMCGAYVDQCPVDIKYIDHILNLRHHQVLMESTFPRELSRAFRGMESKQNPYNQLARKRLGWAKDLNFNVPVIDEDLEDTSEVDYLFWVRCAEAFDDSARRTSAAIAEFLHTAGMSFAVLDSGESCTGDPARRAGDGALFQMPVAQAIETFNEAKPQKIVVSCAHCFNTIAGGFPEPGGHFEVVHHIRFLNRLVREGCLTPAAAPSMAERSATASVIASRGTTTPVAAKSGEQGEAPGTPLHVTYHDACYLRRHDKIFALPREFLASLPGVGLVEMPRHAGRAMCCNTGGAHAWSEGSRGTHIADARIAEAVSTGANAVATACPLCSQVLGSASGASAGLFPVLAPASSASADVGDPDSAGVAPDAGTGKSGGARVGASAGTGTSAGSLADVDASMSADTLAGAGARASVATGTDADAQRIPLMKDVAIILLESVRRGQAQPPVEGEQAIGDTQRNPSGVLRISFPYRGLLLARFE